jgi:hypothetical protein
MNSKPLLLALLIVLAAGAPPVHANADAELAALLEWLVAVSDEDDEDTFAPALRIREVEAALYRIMDILDSGAAVMDEDEFDIDDILFATLGTARVLAQDEPQAAIGLMERLREHLEQRATEDDIDELLAMLDLVRAMYLASAGQQGAALGLGESALARSDADGDDAADFQDVQAEELQSLRILLGGSPKDIVALQIDEADFDRPWVLGGESRYRCGLAGLAVLMPQPVDILRGQGHIDAAAQVLLVGDWRRFAFGCDGIGSPETFGFEAMLDGTRPGSFHGEWRAALATLREAHPPFRIQLLGLDLPLPAGFQDDTPHFHAFGAGAELADLLACGPLGRLLDPQAICAPLPHCATAPVAEPPPP